MNCRITSPQLRSHWDRKLVLTIIQSVRRSWPFCTAQWQKCDDKFAIMGGWSALTASSRLYWLEHYIWLQSGQPRAAAVYTQWGLGNANIDNFRSRCTRYRVCDAGRAEGLASQPPSPGVQGAGSKHMCVGLPTAIFSGHICQFQNTTTIMQVWCLHLSPPTYFSSPARRMTRRTDRWQARNPERTAGCRRHPVRRQSGDSSLPSWSLS